MNFFRRRKEKLDLLKHGIGFSSILSNFPFLIMTNIILSFSENTVYFNVACNYIHIYNETVF